MTILVMNGNRQLHCSQRWAGDSVHKQQPPPGLKHKNKMKLQPTCAGPKATIKLAWCEWQKVSEHLMGKKSPCIAYPRGEWTHWKRILLQHVSCTWTQAAQRHCTGTFACEHNKIAIRIVTLVPRELADHRSHNTFHQNTETCTCMHARARTRAGQN